MSKIRLISIGKTKQAWAELCYDYMKRLKNLDMVVLKEVGDGGDDTRRRSSDLIRAKLSDDDYVILWDETGASISSTAYAKLLDDHSGQKITLIIGSSYGVDNDLKSRASKVLKLSDMVLPHDLARLMVLEQTYRAHTINTNHPYHHS